MDYIDGKQCYIAFILGARSIIEARAELNELNRFPVPDKDTGDNLSTMMQQVLIEIELDHNIGAIIKNIAKKALKTARGNSGIIFAEYLIGLSESIADRDVISTKNFVKASKKGTEYAYKAVKKPVEGTMLTMMKIWGESLECFQSDEIKFKELYKKALEKTETKFIESYKKKSKNIIANDSGAIGFMYFLQGISMSENSSKLKNDIAHKNYETLNQNSQIEIKEESRYRYCLEIYLDKSSHESIDLKKKIENIGDSLVYAQEEKFARVHIHTSNPARVVELAEKSGTIIYTKVDDFKYQVNLKPSNEVAIWTDSIADLPEIFIKKHNIYIIPMQIQIGEDTYLDGVTLDGKSYLNKLKNNKGRLISSQPNKEQIRKQLEFLTKNYKKVIGLFVSSKMSGIYENIKDEAKLYSKSECDVNIIDTKRNSGAQGLLIMKIAKALEAGIDYEKLVNSIDSYIDRTNIFVSVKSFDAMVQNGRLSEKTGRMARKFKVFPIVTIDKNGAGKLCKMSRTSGRCLDKIVKEMIKINQNIGISEYGISYFGSKEEALKLADKLEILLGKKTLFVEQISPIVASSAGEGAIAVSYVEEDRNECINRN
ncbi:MAG: DegV family EDD domain-containing protein [Tissierellales bacterium]|jgi:DegV family protein with EDD domain|nr:DegV family EDD domain-containing protein [Tissierellales bacterium]